jgi:DNA-binding transcriptional regulator YiaG
MQLDAYLRANDLTDEDFAKILGPGVSAWAVRKWRYGQRIPRLAQQLRIREVTKNKVTANDLIAAAQACVSRQASQPEAMRA